MLKEAAIIINRRQPEWGLSIFSYCIFFNTYDFASVYRCLLMELRNVKRNKI